MAGPQYYGTIPNIAQAFQNDPRTKLAQSAMALGSSTAPVAQGGWAVTDGLARAAQAIAGAVINKKQEGKYGEREQAYTQGMADAAKLASTPQPVNPAALNPATANPGMAAAAGALGGGSPAPMQTVDPNTAMGGQGGPQGANYTPPATSLPPGAGMPSGGAPSPVIGAVSPAPVSGGLNMGGGGGGGMSSLEYYRRGIRPIEGGTDPRTGAFLTSPKGAVGPGQIMPSTGPEAARLAGLPWDEKRFKSDARYNDALGAAYYDKQLKDFGDPVIAAAAYNAGGGRVRRAIRQAARSGQDYTAHLPAETQQYVQNFAQAVGGAGNAAPLPGNAGTGIAPPQMEAIPELPQMPTQAPAAPERPAEVQSNRIAMAQSLMQSGNPDLMAIAQQYLDKGLDEQNQARTLASQQEQQQNQTGYTAALNDYGDARSTARNAAVTNYRDTNNRNFQRETTYTDQRFRAGQAEVGRQFDRENREDQQAYGTAERQASEAFQRQQLLSQQGFQSSEAEKERQNRLDVAGIRRDAAGKRDQQRNAYFSTPTGLKMQEAAGKEMNANNDGISKYQRFLDLNERQNTGGIALNTPGIAGLYRFTDSDLTEMNSLANDATLAGLGGSLGTAISDSDRKFIADANISTTNPRQANTNIARAKIGALRRKNDYLLEFANAQADGTAPQFAKDWAAFANSTPIVQYDNNGNVRAVDKPMTFSQWRASRPRYDAQGRKVK